MQPILHDAVDGAKLGLSLTVVVAITVIPVTSEYQYMASVISMQLHHSLTYSIFKHSPVRFWACVTMVVMAGKMMAPDAGKDAVSRLRLQLNVAQ